MHKALESLMKIIMTIATAGKRKIPSPKTLNLVLEVNSNIQQPPNLTLCHIAHWLVHFVRTLFMIVVKSNLGVLKDLKCKNKVFSLFVGGSVQRRRLRCSI